MQTSDYIGNELELFQHAKNWKAYYGSFIKPWLKGRVLEVGAGIGGTALSLCDGTQERWLCLEPDSKLLAEIETKIASKILPACCEAKQGYLSELPKDTLYDAIIYIDVIEHIEDDNSELALAAQYLKPGGKLIVLVPAHQFLYSPFDKAIGHYRRYNKQRLVQISPNSLKTQRIFYLDSFGLLASTANKVLLKQSYPTLKQVKTWDNWLVPVSRVLDPLFGFALGKTVVGIWEK
ncbi:MAG: class I SAM-dependent methyltransferase [Cytophagales bacterium]|nr:class I SAM-dependent methyltransferase [Cytophagales bacterium]